ncbi:hypothetical protein [Phenylobacterium sp.]|nr:hypothetical protein [Phenylobacterium sp.]MDO8380080.1 hypothetical protein [Phenylobacterium sp.]
MGIRAVFAAATLAAVLVGMMLPTPNGHRPAPPGESQIATMTLGAG